MYGTFIIVRTVLSEKGILFCLGISKKLILCFSLYI